MVSQDIGDSRLMELAGILDQTNHYDQGTFYMRYPYSRWNTGPGCALGHWLEHRGYQQSSSLATEIMMMGGAYEWAAHEFCIPDFGQVIALFGGVGCGNARNDGKAAARYIRDFVAKRNAPEIQAVLVGPIAEYVT